MRRSMIRPAESSRTEGSYLGAAASEARTATSAGQKRSDRAHRHRLPPRGAASLRSTLSADAKGTAGIHDKRAFPKNLARFRQALFARQRLGPLLLHAFSTPMPPAA